MEIICFECHKVYESEDSREIANMECPDCKAERIGDPMTREHARFEMWRWQYDRGDNFTQMLYCLINKADPTNRARIKLGFPVEVRAYEEWERSEYPEGLLEQWKEEYGTANAD